MSTEQMREALRKVRPYLEDGANHGDDAVELLKLVDEAITAPAAEVPEAMGDELAWLDGEDFKTALIRYRGAHCFQDQDGIVDRLQAVKDIIRAQWQSTRLRGGVPEPRIDIDFKQATELLAMFGGEPSLVTLMPGDGHSGKGLYAYWTDIPGEGAIYLGVTDDDAAPQAPAAALDAEVVRDAEILRYVMDWNTKDFAVCKRVGATGQCWEPIKTTGPIEAAMSAQAGNGGAA